MSPRVAKAPDVRRDELLDAAVRLCVDPGWDSFSIGQITDLVGVAKGTFYYHFSSKTDLLEQLCQRFGDALFARIDTQLPLLTGSAADRVQHLIALATDWKIAHLDDAMGSFPLLFKPENAEVRHRLFETWVGQCRPLFAPLIALGHQDGSFDVDDPEATTEVFLSLWVDSSTRLLDRALGADTTDEFVDILVRGQRALANAAERIIGAAPGTFALSAPPDAIRALHAPFLAALGRTPPPANHTAQGTAR